MKAPRIAGHPIHPLTTHLPIGILLLSVVCDAIGLVVGAEIWTARATFLIIAGLLSAIPTVLSGMAELLGVSEDSPILRPLIKHMGAAAVALTAFGVGLTLRLSAETAGAAAYVASAVGAIALLITGRYGGDMVFVHGHGVEPRGSLEVHPPHEAP